MNFKTWTPYCALLAVILLGSSLLLFGQQDTDFALLGPDLIAAQAKMAGEWNLAFCGNPDTEGGRYSLSVTDDVITAKYEQSLSALYGVGLRKERRHKSAGFKYAFKQGDRLPYGDQEVDILTFVRVSSGKNGLTSELKLLLTPDGKIKGNFDVTDANDKTESMLVFGQRGDQKSLAAFVAHAQETCHAVHVLALRDNDQE